MTACWRNNFCLLSSKASLAQWIRRSDVVPASASLCQLHVSKSFFCFFCFNLGINCSFSRAFLRASFGLWAFRAARRDPRHPVLLGFHVFSDSMNETRDIQHKRSLRLSAAKTINIDCRCGIVLTLTCLLVVMLFDLSCAGWRFETHRRHFFVSSFVSHCKRKLVMRRCLFFVSKSFSKDSVDLAAEFEHCLRLQCMRWCSQFVRSIAPN